MSAGQYTHTVVTHFSHLKVLIPCTVHYFYIASFSTVVLYNCGDLSGDDCSGCLGLSADYRCGYCQPNCILNSLTCGSSVIQTPNFQQCGVISVIEVSEFMLFCLLSTTYIIVNLSFSTRPPPLLVLLLEVLCSQSRVPTWVLTPGRISASSLVGRSVRLMEREPSQEPVWCVWYHLQWQPVVQR